MVDSTNQLLLMWGRRQARKPPDKYHPLGYGRELYFWSFVVAVLVFSLGAGVSIYEGIIHIAHPEEAVSPIVAYVVLLVAFVLEGWSTLEAFKEFREAKGKLGWFEAIRRSKDPPAFIVLLENGAAMAGIVAAAAGVFLAHVTRNPFYDGAASVVIGVILGLTAFLLAYESKGLLIGEAADPEMVRALRDDGLRKEGYRRRRPCGDAPFGARPDRGDDQRRFPKFHHCRRSRADRPNPRERGARALAGIAAPVHPADGRRGRGTQEEAHEVTRAVVYLRS